MSPQSKREYVIITKERYKKAKKGKKSRILDEFSATYGCHRKHATRILNTPLVPPIKVYKKQGRPPLYGDPAIKTILTRIWMNSNYPCSKRFKAVIPLWLPGYQKTFEKLSDTIIQLLLRISPATIDRLIKPLRVKYTKHGRSTTKPGTLLRKQIPISTEQWDQSKPGFLEADLIAHCGTSLLGTFANTIDAVDIATGWTEQRAAWGKGEEEVIKQIKDIERSLPFPLLGFDSDNGSEFINYHLIRYFHKRITPIQFTRSRPYHKNDNAHVEQKNWTHVRQWLGYDRFDNPKEVKLLNDLYKSEWRLFLNFFCPSMKLVSKQRIGSQTVKRHDCPKTPYQRILESTYVHSHVKDQLTAIFTSLNPFTLRKAMETKIKKVFAALSKD